MTKDGQLPLSPTRRVGNLVYVSGQVATDPRTGSVVAGGIAEQTRQVIRNVRDALAAHGLGLSNVVKTTVFLVSPRDFDAFNAVYREFFSAPFPARSTISVALVSPDLQIEIEAIAEIPNEE
jgi:2-iminobutanoate/2-iminopropanoate deaminase